MAVKAHTKLSIGVEWLIDCKYDKHIVQFQWNTRFYFMFSEFLQIIFIYFVIQTSTTVLVRPNVVSSTNGVDLNC